MGVGFTYNVHCCLMGRLMNLKNIQQTLSLRAKKKRSLSIRLYNKFISRLPARREVVSASPMSAYSLREVLIM